MKSFQRRLSVALVAGLLLLSGGCASDTKVGGDGLTNFKDKVGGNLNEQSPTATPRRTLAASASTAPSTRAPVQVVTRAPTQAPRQTPAAAPPFVIAINGDNSATSQFDPSVVRVFQGQVLQWVNRDKVARSVVSDSSAFASPLIPPGKTFTYTASRAGSFNYHDGTRPYAVASFQVLKR